MTKPFPGQKVPIPILYEIICDIIFADSKFKKTLSGSLNLKGAETIADIGCGSGRLLKMIKNRYPKTKITGIDPDTEMIALAKIKPSDIKFVLGEGAKLPIKTNSVKIVISTLTLHHMDDSNKNQTLKEMKRITKKGGRIIIADIDQPKTLFDRFVVWLIMFVENADYIKISLEGNLPKLLKKHLPNLKAFGKHRFVTFWQANL